MSAAIIVTGFVVWAIGVLRIGLVFRARRRRLDAISDSLDRDVGRSDFISLMAARYAELDHPTQNEMVFDFSAWTYRQFYPREVA